MNSPASRRVRTIAWGAIPVVLTGALVSLDHIPGTDVSLTVPYAAEGPGPTVDTLGEVDGTQVVDVQAPKTYDTDGHLNMTTVSVRTNMTLAQALGRWMMTDDTIVPIDTVIPQNMSDKEVEQVKEREGQRLLAKVKQQSTVITLEIKGNMLTSEGLAKEIESRMTRGQSDFTFIIGGSNGLHKDVLDRSDYALSFSKMTFPHQMMRVILIEQVYRAFKIMRGEAYHK